MSVHLFDDGERYKAGAPIHLRFGQRRDVVWPTAANVADWSEDPTSGTVEITDAGRDALMRSEGYEPGPLAFFRQRQAIAGRCTMAEQVASMRHSPDDSSSAQPHRFRSAE